MSEITFESAVDSRGRRTKLFIDPDLASINSIQLIDSNSQILTSIKLSSINLFAVRFRPYKLVENPNLPMPPTVEFKITSATQNTVTPGPGFLTLNYNAVPCSLDGQPVCSYGTIKVSITFKAPSTSDRGWIDLDITYTYPNHIKSDDSNFGWETTLIYPQVCVSNDPATAEDDLEKYILLTPIGTIGGLKTLKPESSGKPAPVQFAALYKTGKAGGIEFAEGLALSATDERGSYKEFHYGTASGGKYFLRYHLLSPIHLKAHKFVRPSSYTLSSGDDYDFGGARMHFRLRAFRVEAACKDQVVDWFDVANIYRDWVKTRTATIYRKHIPDGISPRDKSAPMDLMHPHTIISNYSLDGPIGKFDGNEAVRRWLEVHPARDGAPDMPGNINDSIKEILVLLKNKFGIADIKLEAQIWGFEMGGFYHFLGGFPPVTDVLSGAGNFKTAMDQLVRENIIPIITTDPLSTYFNRKRFRGHLLLKNGEWTEAIPNDFPDNVKAITSALTEEAGNNRFFHVLPPPSINAKPNCSEAQLMAGFLKRDANGNLLIFPDRLTRFHGIENRLICPTKEVENLYLNTWLRNGILAYGTRLIEFMKHGQQFFHCFDKSHTHIVSPIQSGDYDNVIGYGSWYVQRIKEIWGNVHKLCRKPDSPHFVPYFALTNEHAAPEALVPYYDEYYDHLASSLNAYSLDTRSPQSLNNPQAERKVPLYHFIYSAMVGQKMNLADSDHQIHVGYKEKRNGTSRVKPTFMLQAGRDTDNPDFNTWKTESTNSFNNNFTVKSQGLAPAGYPVNQSNPYNYRRGIQSVFNLRSQIFRFGIAAVYGERILVPSTWVEEPADFYDEALNMAVRAVHFHIRFSGFFKEGAMLGQTKILSNNRTLRAWRANYRNFIDVRVLVNKLYQDNAFPQALVDYISRGVDTEMITPVHRAGDYSEADKRAAQKITTEQIHHMVWQRTMGDGSKRSLYAFANVGNTPQTVKFLYSRGLDQTDWNTQIFTFSGNPNGQPVKGPMQRLETTGTVSVPERSIVAVLVFK